MRIRIGQKILLDVNSLCSNISWLDGQQFISIAIRLVLFHYLLTLWWTAVSPSDRGEDYLSSFFDLLGEDSLSLASRLTPKWSVLMIFLSPAFWQKYSGQYKLNWIIIIIFRNFACSFISGFSAVMKHISPASSNLTIAVHMRQTRWASPKTDVRQPFTALTLTTGPATMDNIDSIERIKYSNQFNLNAKTYWF